MNKLIILLLNLYKKAISPLLPQSCRFVPTCSEYAMESFRLYSFFPALWLTISRVIRCSPWFEGGHDPVPLPKKRG